MPSQELFDRAYSERAIVVKLLVVLAARLGYKYGWGIDDNESSVPSWRRVMYVELPEGQVSWHIAPDDQGLFSDIGQYRGRWDGTHRGKTKEFANSLNPGSTPWQKEYEDVQEQDAHFFNDKAVKE